MHRLISLTRGLLIAALYVVAAASSSALAQAPQATGVTVFEGARLITGDGNAPIEDSAFVVENNRLKSVTCGASPTVMFSAPLPVSHGEFSFVGEDGLSVSGRIVSAANAVGEINIVPCATRWWADKR